MARLSNNQSHHLLSLLAAIAGLLLPGCAKQKENVDMNFNELKKHVSTSLKKQSYQESATALETMITKNPDQLEIHKFKILLADVYFKLQRYQSAYQLYENYCKQYPSHEKAEYAKYQAILSKFYQTLKVDCDQTVTSDTINLCEEYNSHKHFKKYTKDVLDIKKTCEHKLVNKEIYVFNYYLNKNKLEAAKNRLAYLKTEFLPKQPSLAARLHYLECKLAKKAHDESSVKQLLAILTKDFPDSQFTRMAQDLIHKPQFIF